MKKIMLIFVLFLCLNNMNAEEFDKNTNTCSPSYGIDLNKPCPYPLICSILAANWSANWGCFNANINKANTDIQLYWRNEIKPIIDDIKEESESRKKKLETIKNLEKERLLVNKEIEFLLRQETELLSNQADLESLRSITE